MPVKKNYYRCDKYFHTELIEDLFTDHLTVGVVITSGSETSIWNVTGTQTVLKRKFTLHRQKNQKCGGQSAPRFQRIRENQIHEYIGKIIENISVEFAPTGTINVATIIIAGAAFIRDKVISDERLPNTIKNYIVMGISSENINEVIADSANVINRAVGSTIDQELYEFFEKIELSDSKYIYGSDDINVALKQKIVKSIYILDNHKELNLITKLADECSATIKIVNGITDMCEKLKSFGGFVALLWYNPGDYLFI